MYWDLGAASSPTLQSHNMGSKRPGGGLTAGDVPMSPATPSPGLPALCLPGSEPHLSWGAGPLSAGVQLYAPAPSTSNLQPARLDQSCQKELLILLIQTQAGIRPAPGSRGAAVPGMVALFKQGAAGPKSAVSLQRC